MHTVIIGNIKYELIVDYKNGYDKEAFTSLYTDYFKNYDYILGDWAYGKLRLKGFCTKENPHYNKINDYNTKEQYLNKQCAYDCKYFILKKIGA